MDIETKSYGDVVVLAPAGRIDHTNCERFLQDIDPQIEACRAPGTQLVFDLSQIDYISSAGLRCFLVAAKRVQPRGGTMVIAQLTPVVKEIFDISRFSMIFPIYETVRDALAQLSPQTPASLDGK